MKNPFVFGGPVAPDDFYGRGDTVAFMLDRLYGRSRSSIALWGDRRVGKTSLLHYVAQPQQRNEWNADPSRHHIIFIDCQIFGQFSRHSMWREVLEQASFLDTDAAWQGEAQRLLDAETFDERPLRQMFTRMQQTGDTLTLLLDEFSYISGGRSAEEREEIRAWMAFARTLITAVNPVSPHPRPLAIVTATRRPLDEVCRPLYGQNDTGSPFHNPFVFERLKPFTKADVQALLQAKLANSDIQFTDGEIEQLLATAGRHPILVQSYAGELFNAHRKTSAEITDFTPIEQVFYDRNQPHFQDFWHYSGEAEQRFLADYIGDRLDWSKLSAEQESARRQLLDRGLLNADRTLFSPLFRDWLRLNLPRLQALARSPLDGADLARLLSLLDQHFSNEELRTLAFELSVDYDNLVGSGKQGKARELIGFMQRNGRLSELQQIVKQKRPQLSL